VIGRNTEQTTGCKLTLAITGVAPDDTLCLAACSPLDDSIALYVVHEPCVHGYRLWPNGRVMSDGLWSGHNGEAITAIAVASDSARLNATKICLAGSRQYVVGPTTPSVP